MSLESEREYLIEEMEAISVKTIELRLRSRIMSALYRDTFLNDEERHVAMTTRFEMDGL